MTFGQQFARLVTVTVVRWPRLWGLFRGPLTRSFDRLAPEWDTTRASPARLDAISAALDAVPSPPAAVLDLGTGSGAVARHLAARWPGAQVTGADVSEGMIAAARDAATTDRERYVAADASALPFEDGAFELVALNNMIPFFDELARVTAPGGHVAVAYSRGPPDADLGAARPGPARARAPRIHALRDLLRRRGRQPPCPEAGSVVSFSAQGRSRRGSTGPDVSFRAATLAAPPARAGTRRGEVAQLVEHTAENRGVAGSSPALAIPGAARR